MLVREALEVISLAQFSPIWMHISMLGKRNPLKLSNNQSINISKQLDYLIEKQHY